MKAKALIAGIATYRNNRFNYPAINNDVPAISRILDKFNIKDTQILRDENATSTNIVAGLDWLIRDAQSGDVAIFYISCHGVTVPPGSGLDPDQAHEAILPYEGTDDSLIYDSWIGSFLRQKVAPAGVSFWGIYDCCYSGEMYRMDGASRIKTKSVRYSDISAGKMSPYQIRPGKRSSSWALIVDGVLSNSFHLGACLSTRTAGSGELPSGSGIKRSIFTYALEQELTPGETITGLERKIRQNRAMLDAGQEPQMAIPPGNVNRSVFT